MHRALVGVGPGIDRVVLVGRLPDRSQADPVGARDQDHGERGGRVIDEASGRAGDLRLWPVPGVQQDGKVELVQA